MTTSSEDVLMSVGHVRYKKGDGTLYVMNQRLAWMLENRDTVAVSHKYADIKTQKISPVGKPKVQLQVVLHDGTCSTFHFVNPAGAEAQAKDRDQVITSEEYWNTPTLKNYTDSNNVKQEAGVSGAFLADIQPQTDGCNGLKYNLTQDIIDAIFKTYPAVRKKHVDYVPNKMTEAEFWTKFFQSHYFHRDRIASSSSKDLFGECAKLDDHAIASAMKHTTLDLTPVPLLPTDDDAPVEKDRGDKNGVKETNGSAEKRPSEDKAAEPVNKKARILENLHYEDLEDSNKNEESQELKLSKIERTDPTGREGRAEPSVPVSGRAAPRAVALLPQPGAAPAAAPAAPSAPDAAARAANFYEALLRFRNVKLRPFEEKMLHDLTPLATSLTKHINQMIDVACTKYALWQQRQAKLRRAPRRPPRPPRPPRPTPPRRAANFYEALLRFRNVKLRPFEEKMLHDLTPLATSLTKHINQMIDVACTKYALWQQRQAKLR
ncbi:hypothetical protein MSG28_011991 [Choristoneura fumiferana]|uniref:Uncharacterized protein n=1 Tax=Choristoneura fumiferana TaxID=7141 RepID=A0ACC0KND7_CHOFU|nr:hypothetical protein MSG28_011991 [Choristoneura fumiferana]